MHQIFLSITTSFALAAAAAVQPNLPFQFPSSQNCDLTQAKLQLPANAGDFNLTIPTGRHISAVSVGFGVQNYTCDPTSKTFTSIGAVGELIDESCDFLQTNFSTVQNNLFTAWKSISSSTTIQDVITQLNGHPGVPGQHYFVENATSKAVVPVWDYRPSMPTHPRGFVDARKVGQMPAPTGANDVPWLKLVRVEGDLAYDIFRINTMGGQPPTSCTPGAAPTSINYSAVYVLFR